MDPNRAVGMSASLLSVLASLGVTLVAWQWNSPLVGLTVGDFQTGGLFSADERRVMTVACGRLFTDAVDARCACVVDKAGRDLSRFDRMVATALMTGDAQGQRLIARVKVAAGVPRVIVKAGSEGVEARYAALVRACKGIAPIDRQP